MMREHWSANPLRQIKEPTKIKIKRYTLVKFAEPIRKMDFVNEVAQTEFGLWTVTTKYLLLQLLLFK